MPSDTSEEPLARLTDFLVRHQSLIREQIRRQRDDRDVLLSTSELYAEVVEQAFEESRASNTDSRLAVQTTTEADAGRHLVKRILRLIDRTVAGALIRVRHQRSGERHDLAASARLDDHDPRMSNRRDEMTLRVREIVAGLEPLDRDILYFRLRGSPWSAISPSVGISEAACRQRWVRILAHLRPRLAE